MQTIQTREMQLGDVVRSSDQEFSDSTVKQIQDGFITLVRPYIHTSDFATTGGLITYIGLEEYKVFQDSSRTWTLLSRKTIR